jgi:hypothetical protein
VLDVLNDPERDESPEEAELREEIDQVERVMARRIDPGRRGFAIALLAFVLIVAILLPWVGDSTGWQVLVHGEDGAIPRLFAATAVGFGIGATTLALLTRRWWLSWVCALGSCIMVIDGVLAVWSQQSSAAPGVAGDGPGIGMVVALVVAVLLAVNWLRIAWSRANTVA